VVIRNASSYYKHKFIINKVDWHIFWHLLKKSGAHNKLSVFRTKKRRLMQKHKATFQRDEKEKRLVVLSALLFNKFDKQLEVFRIHVGQNAMTEIENMPRVLGMLTE